MLTGLHSTATFSYVFITTYLFKDAKEMESIMFPPSYILFQYNLPSDDSEKSDAGSIYATNVAHATMAPVFHVNSQDPEAVVYCMKVAAEYRAKFKS